MSYNPKIKLNSHEIPKIKLISHGIPKHGDFNYCDEQRVFLKIPSDPNDIAYINLKKHFDKPDIYFNSQQFKDKLFRKTY